MAAEKLSCVGLVCCLAALLVQVFPGPAFEVGIDVKAAWFLFGFGVFLLLLASVSGFGGRGR